MPEPWLRGTLTDVHPVLRAVLHALELAQEDIGRFCGDLTDQEVNTKASGLPSVAFQIKHISRSLARLLTYAEGRPLSDEQHTLASSEHEDSRRDELLKELHLALLESAERVRKFEISSLNEPRTVGRKNLPSTAAGLLIHIAEHTQRHVGQAITTAKLVVSMRA